MNRLRFRKYIFLVYVIPLVSIFLLFRYYPIGEAVILSVTKFNPAGPRQFVGLEHFKEVIKNQEFWNSIGRSAYFMSAYTLGSLILPLFVALAINAKDVRGKTFFKIIFFLPLITATSVLCYLWRVLFDPSFGPINTFIQNLGFPPVSFLTNSKYTMNTLVSVALWKDVGLYMAIFLANLQMINPTLYEAAKCDGANSWQQFVNITVSQLTPAFSLVAFMGVVNGFQVFVWVYILTKGGPGRSTEVTVYHMYRTAFKLFEYGEGGAMSLIFFVIIMAVAFIPIRLLRLV